MRTVSGDSPGTSGASSERLFIALSLPDPIRASLARLADPIHGATWTRQEQLHLTLRFLGDVPTGTIDRLEELLSGIRVKAFILPVEGVGRFPARGPARTLWAGTGAGHPHLFQLRQRIDDALLAGGVDCDIRTFQPHVTLARCSEASAGGAEAWVRRHAAFTAASFRVNAFELWKSRLLPQGSEHTLRKRFPLS
jgi:2'-5' RNA ligase